jgi:hypothetical protein
MTIYTLYKKVDKNSGLHYLGMTTQDPFKYSGSGIDWRSHLKNNDTDVETSIIFQTTNKKDFKLTGQYYSGLWNIVGAMDDYGNKIWANRIPETESGPGWKSGNNNPMKNPISLQKMISSKTGQEPWNKGLTGQQVAWNKGYKETRPVVLKNIQNAALSRPNQLGLKKPAAIHTVYEFIHLDGRTEMSTPYELRSKYNLSQSQTSMMIKGTCKSVKGWRLVNPPTYTQVSLE